MTFFIILQNQCELKNLYVNKFYLLIYLSTQWQLYLLWLNSSVFILDISLRGNRIHYFASGAFLIPTS